MKAKDVRLIDDESLEITGEPQSMKTYSEHGLLESCSITPHWKPKTISGFQMMPPDSLGIESMLTAPSTNVPDLDSQLALLGDLRSSPNKKATDVSSMLIKKYYETLYVAQTPVSYFAKSALSRARAMCKEKYQPLDDTPKQRALYLDKLIPILKSMILDILDLDSKYDAENFWQAIMSPQNFSAYSRDEQSYMKTWAADLDDQITTWSVNSPQFKQGVELLKTREIQLQIIILMEILALEASRDSKLGKDKTTSAVTKRPVVLNPRQTGLVRLKKRPKKADKEDTDPEPSTQVLAITMFDRLCIRNLSEGEDISKSLGTNHFETPALAAAAADKTQEFCREAIMPFFNSRLPELCKTLVQSCRGNSTALSRSRLAKKQPTTEPKPIEQDKPSTGSLASFKESQTSLTKAGKTASFRGGLLNPKKSTDDRRQIEMTFRSSISQQDTDDELRNAIREASKPSRVSVSQQHANNLPSTQIKALPKRKSALVRPYKQRPVSANTQETKKVEVASTPIRRKRQLKAGHRSSQKSFSISQNVVLIDGEIYSGGEEDKDGEDEEVIFETPMKKKTRYDSGTNFNDRLAALSASSVPKLSTAVDDEEILSSPVMKTPHYNNRTPGLIPVLSSERHEATSLNPVNPIYDENSPLCLFPDRSPLRAKHKSANSPSSTAAVKLKSQQWFDNEFPMTKSQSDLF